MKKTIFLDEYPVYTLELFKGELNQTNIDELAFYFKDKIKSYPIAKFVAIFDNFQHTKTINGEIMDGLIGAQNVIFCFGKAIPNTKILALRPRSIGICEFEDRFIIEFLQAPNQEIQKRMEAWVKDLVLKQ